MIKRVVKIKTTKEMVANDINELITGSDIDQEPLENNECVIDIRTIEDYGHLIVLVLIGEK
jgi:hypothetical protein|nr:MAG TPA: hypothetical protein [Caudoviricetes sp.]